jgi:uncharacterized RDD family membrane protein YckC
MKMETDSAEQIDRLLEKIVREAEKEDAKLNYATFFQRVVARLVDTAIVLAIAYSLQLWFDHWVVAAKTFNAAYLVHSVNQVTPAFAVVLWAVIYSPIFEGTGGSPGKRLMRIQLLDEKTNEQPAFRNCFARSVLYMLLILLILAPAVFSCLAVLFTEKKQTWHDLLTGMVCVRR